MRRAGLYLRISKDPSGERLAVERQQRDGEEMIRRRGWTLTDTYVDNDLSAKGRRQRPEFQRLMHDVRDRHVDIVTADRWDRLSRNRRDDLTIIETCQPASTLLAFMRGSDIDLSSAAGRLTADFMSAVARNEIEVKSERQIRQALQAAEKGLPGAVGQRSFGYLPGGLHLDPVEAPLLAEMYSRFLAGEPMAEIGRWLNANGVTTPRGNRWRHQNVREVLANPRNGGLRGIREIVNEKTGTRAQWHRIVGKAVWPAAVPADTWRATMDRILDPSRPGWHAGYNRPTYLLSNIARCGICEHRMVTGGSQKERRLRCSESGHLSRRADYIEAWVEQHLLARFERGDVPQLARPTEDAGELRTQAKAARTRLDALARKWAVGEIDDQQLQVGSQVLRRQLAEIDERIVRLSQRDVTAGLRASTDVEATWKACSMSTKRAVIRQVLDVWVLPGFPGRPGGLRFHPETVRVVWGSDDPKASGGDGVGDGVDSDGQ